MLEFFIGETSQIMSTNVTNPQGGTPNEPLREKYFLWMVLCATAITYLGVLRFDFDYDDYPQIVFNPFVRAWNFVPQYFVSSVWKQMSPFAPGNYYRPLFLLLLRVNYSIFANRALGWHLVTLGLHLVVTWQVFRLVKKMTGEFTLAWLSAALFGLHPVHHEVVGWISATTESLFAVLFLAGFLAYLNSKARSRTLWMAASCALYAAALLAKETAIVLPALVFVFAWLDDQPEPGHAEPSAGDRLKSALFSAGMYLPVALLYLIARNRILSGLGHSWAPVSLKSWLFTLPSILLFYVRHLFLPVGMSESYDVYYQNQFSIAHVALPTVALLATAGAIFLLRNRLGSKAVAYALAWILVPLLPALDTFVFRPDELVHDRYLYVPSIGVALLFALAVSRLARSHKALFGQPAHVVALGAAVSLIFAALAVSAVRYWTDDYTLFTRAHQIAPLNGTAANNLSAEMIARHELDPAISILLDGYRRDPSDSRIALNLGRVYYKKGDLAKAEEYIQHGRMVDPGLADLYVTLGQIRLKQNRTKEAQEDLRQAVQLSPYSAPYHTSYGMVLALNGDCAGADREFDEALSLNPGEGLTLLQKQRCQAAQTPKPPATKPGQP